MALSPFQPIEERVDAVDEITTVEPSKTYRLSYESNEISGLIDGEEALRQFIIKAITTARFRFLIYDEQYGSELDELIGADVSLELLQMEIPRVITEALIYDDRVADVTDFEVTRDGDKLFVSFRVVTTEGEDVILDEMEVGL
ncbi:DUF2634 domain-containing protein [Cytobacillus solani]|uniref:Terminase n=1 Tax=Cytobacillus solani TaxID=1637975 RepID=A0A0Q3VHF6_9BACI|nr:DUF2634 domain-containing protein [Cytobacillus solani]KQL18863.1 terminase [Cytobacillus solani]